jgi:hypothetical protein
MTIRPLHDRILVKRLEEETKTAGGLFIPDTEANAVKVTLGPKGRNVVIEKSFGAPTSPRTASPSPRRSSSRTSSRTWARRW